MTDSEAGGGARFRGTPGMIVRPAAGADAAAIATLLNAHLATTTIEWTDMAHTPDGMAAWLDEHETTLVAEEGATLWAWPHSDGSGTR